MVDISIDTVCNLCGKAVEVDYLGYELVVTPCEKCLDDKYDEGYEVGREEGQLDTH